MSKFWVRYGVLALSVVKSALSGRLTTYCAVTTSLFTLSPRVITYSVHDLSMVSVTLLPSVMTLLV